MSKNTSNFTARFFKQIAWMNHYLKGAIECKIAGDIEGLNWYKNEMRLALASARFARIGVDLIL